MALWLIRAGSNGEYEKKFLNKNRVYLTWDDLSYDLSKIQKKRDLYDLLINVYPDCKRGTTRNWTGQIWLFAQEMNEKDWIVLPSKLNREVIHVGEITGPYAFDSNAENPFFHHRTVRWVATNVLRSDFGQNLRRYFGARQTICRLKRDNAESRVREIAEAGRKYDEIDQTISDRGRFQPADVAKIYKFNTSSAGIKNLVRFGETDKVEFKKKLPPGDIIVQTISAFANTNSGILLIGINDDGEIVGLPQEEIDLTIKSLEKITFSLLPFPAEIGHAEIDRKPIVYAIIEKPSSEYLPITTARGEAYQRRFTKNVRMESPDFRESVELGPVSTGKIPHDIIVFVAMSFKEEQEPALVDYFKAMERAVIATGLPLRVRRIDLEEGDYEISQQIMEEIDKSHIVIADFTLNPRNVYFELGYSRGKNIRVIQTARTDAELEFDVRNWRTVFYRNATELESKLVPALIKAYQEINVI